jgi:hypothetical protein
MMAFAFLAGAGAGAWPVLASQRSRTEFAGAVAEHTETDAAFRRRGVQWE